MSTAHDVIREAYELGDLEEALRLLKLHLRTHREDGRGWELAGLIHYARGRVAVAVSAIERASLLVPLSPAARVCLTHGYIRIGKADLARDLMANLLQDPGLTAPLLLQVATGLDAIRQPAMAMQAARKAMQLDGGLAQAYYDMGYYAARCGIPAEYTESLARRAIALDPDNVGYRIGLVSHLLRFDRSDDAYRIVCRLASPQIESIRCPNCLQRMIQVYRDAGDYRRVIVCQQRLLLLEAQGVHSDCA